LVTVWVVASLSFFLVRCAPGDPFLNEVRNLSPEVRAARMREYHLDRPLLEQYARWLGNVCQGDLGPSMKYRGKSVASIIGQALPTSLALGSIALMLAVILGLAAGIFAALHQNRMIDYVLMSIAVLGISLPSFVIATLLIIVFVFGLALFPLAGWDDYRHVPLPALALSLPFAARISRLTRAGMLEVLSEDFIRTAAAKGLRQRHIVVKHALRGGILPVVSFLGPAAALILTGSLVIEKIFFIPGLGKIFVQAAINRDYYVVLGAVVVFSGILCLFNFLVDVSYTFLDPRVRLHDTDSL
jgi:oligopeptide transport system permease protein